MSKFAVTIERLASVEPHPNADRLEIGRLTTMAYPFVLPKGQFKKGDLVAYIPEDAIIPPRLLEKLGLTGKLAGPEMNRVKAIRLRGVVSQGIVATVEACIGDWIALETDPVGQDITPFTGITKYDPPVNDTATAYLRPLAVIHRSKYDIESSDRYIKQADALMDVEVVVTEKIEGENTIVHCDSSGVYVGSRESVIEEKPGCVHPAWEYVRNYGHPSGFTTLEIVKQLFERYEGNPITMYAERIGPSLSVGNYYGMPTTALLFFDIRIGHEYMSWPRFVELAAAYNLPGVPVLGVSTLRQWLDGKTLREAASGYSMMRPEKRREGIVIKPTIELPHDDQIGRVILKQHSPEYRSQ